MPTNKPEGAPVVLGPRPNGGTGTRTTLGLVPQDHSGPLQDQGPLDHGEGKCPGWALIQRQTLVLGVVLILTALAVASGPGRGPDLAEDHQDQGPLPEWQQRLEAAIAANVKKRTAKNKLRAERAEARYYGLMSRHAAKLARNRKEKEKQ